jgi:hypothetical protein
MGESSLGLEKPPIDSRHGGEAEAEREREREREHVMARV